MEMQTNRYRYLNKNNYLISLLLLALLLTLKAVLFH